MTDSKKTPFTPTPTQKSSEVWPPLPKVVLDPVILALKEKPIQKEKKNDKPKK